MLLEYLEMGKTHSISCNDSSGFTLFIPAAARGHSLFAAVLLSLSASLE